MTAKARIRSAAVMLAVTGAARWARATQISAGNYHSMAVAVGGELVGWVRFCSS